jgi:outer membrane protein OmpA-like peptidoglycan-associated protein
MRPRVFTIAVFAVLVACGASHPTTSSAPVAPTSTPATPKPIDVTPHDEISDADGDGVLDPDDKCPKDAEDHDGFEDGDGCPDVDNDHDGISDKVDQCPNEPETYNGKQDEDGCPDNFIFITDPAPVIMHVRFAVGSATISAEAKVLIDEVAKLILAHPELTIIGVEGFADDPGGVAGNVALSQKRADVVTKELVARKVDAARLRAKGFGAYCPLDIAPTAMAHERNRRVSFLVLETTQGITSATAGCPDATKAGLVLTP